MNQNNPYNILAFYQYRPAFQEPAPLYCSPALMSFQVRKTTITTVDSFELLSEDGSTTDMDTSRIETACTTGYGSYATYKAVTAPGGIPDGKYQFKLVLDGVAYYSHPFCVDSRLSNMYEKIVDYVVQQDTPDIYVLTLTFDTALAHGRRVITFEQSGNNLNRTVWVSPGRSTLTLTEDDGTGLISTVVTFKHDFEGGSWMQSYVLAYDSSDVAGTISLTLLDEAYNVGNEGYYLVTFTNSTDITDMNLFYQDGYTQKLFLKAYHRAPQVINEERFQSNAKGTPFFNSQTIAERFVLDFMGVPDYLQAVLKGIQNHSSVTMYNTTTGQSAALSRPQFEFTAVDGDVILKGTLSYESNRALVACGENMEVC